MFKIESLKLSETAEFEVPHPVTGEPLEDEQGNKVVLTMYGTSSRQYRTAVDKLVRKKNARGKKESTLKEAREESIDFLSDLSLSLTNLEYNGAPVEGKEAFVALYSDESLSWLREFANASVTSTEDFFTQ